MRPDLGERLVSYALAVAALVIAGAFAFGQVVRRPPARPVPKAPSYVSDWRRLLDDGESLGPTDAPIKVIEFADFECPFCRRADSVYREVSKRYGSAVSFVFVHDPLRIHRFAIPAARAAECAARQGRFSQFHDLLYDQQDSLGLKSWSAFARDAGVRSMDMFERCVAAGDTATAIRRGLDAARAFRVNATPTVLINGWRFSSPPSLQQFDSTIRALGWRRGGEH